MTDYKRERLLKEAARRKGLTVRKYCPPRRAAGFLIHDGMSHLIAGTGKRLLTLAEAEAVVSGFADAETADE